MSYDSALPEIGTATRAWAYRRATRIERRRWRSCAECLELFRLAQALLISHVLLVALATITDAVR